MLAQGNPDVQKAVRRLVELSADDKARMIAEAREKNRRDAAAYAKDARDEGLAEALAKGRTEGLAKGYKDVARKMLQRSRPLEEIMEMTGLSMQEIRELQTGIC